jgi:cell division protein YceG involved in septum cleavage
VQLNLENSRSESLSESLQYLFIIILFFVLFVLIQFGLIFYAIKRITSQPVSQSSSSSNIIGQVHSNPQLESLEMLKNKGFISEEEYFRQRQSLMARQA